MGKKKPTKKQDMEKSGRRYDFRKKLIRSVRCYPCLYDPHNEGYVRGPHREIWNRVSMDCGGRNGAVCRGIFDRILLQYGQFYVVNALGLPQLRVNPCLGINEMKFFQRFIPMEKVKERLLSSHDFTEAEKNIILRFEKNSRQSPDREWMPPQGPQSEYQPAFHTNSAHSNRPNRPVQSIQQRNLRAPAPSAPQHSGANSTDSQPSQPNPHVWHNSEYRRRNRDPDSVDMADIELFFGDISQATVKSGASSDDFQDIQNIILNILAEKLPQYNTN